MDAFTGGVKPGGLNSTQHIRIMLCYLIKNVPQPLSKDEIQNALLGEELVNYFDLTSILHNLCETGFIEEQGGRYILLQKGENIATELSGEVPLTVRETGLRASLRVQSFAAKAAIHKTTLEKLENGCYNVHCFIEDGGEEVFRLKLLVPNLHSAEFAQKQFVELGQAVYALTLAGLTGSADMSLNALEILTDNKFNSDKV